MSDSLDDLGSLSCEDGDAVFVDGSVGADADADAGAGVNAETACFSSR